MAVISTPSRLRSKSDNVFIMFGSFHTDGPYDRDECSWFIKPENSPKLLVRFLVSFSILDLMKHVIVQMNDLTS